MENYYARVSKQTRKIKHFSRTCASPYGSGATVWLVNRGLVGTPNVHTEGWFTHFPRKSFTLRGMGTEARGMRGQLPSCYWIRAEAAYPCYSILEVVECLTSCPRRSKLLLALFHLG